MGLLVWYQYKAVARQHKNTQQQSLTRGGAVTASAPSCVVLGEELREALARKI